ncbi:MAG: DNA polymerase/3'-5' exonuclease PolX, partial [Syntrophales bacterium]|nr:DNA polymerase/3'-5' exonuclease PolX [Syntrophales bacterium]
VRSGKLAEVKGIGDALYKKISELVTTGRLQYYEELKASIPPGHFEMLKIPGLGPKRIKALYDALQIETMGELEYACNENHLVDLKGFGKKTQDKILSGIEIVKRYMEKHLYSEVIPEAQALLHAIESRPEVLAVSLAGSLRRGNEVVKDIDILAASEDPVSLGEYFVHLPGVQSITGQGETKVSIVLKTGINADLRIVSMAEFPYALHHFTGSREHNTAMRGRAKKMGLKMNEYGLFSGSENIPCHDEKEIFSTLELQFIPPELRENMGEIEAAERNKLPRLLEAKDIRGVFHIHTNTSDGADSLEVLVKRAKALGYSYIGISDHSQTAAYANGISIDDIERQHAEIDEINAREAPFHIFKGIETEILTDGRLDYDEKVLERFDFIIAGIHSLFGMPEDAMTKRILTALAHPLTTILAHPTGRILLAREPYALNLRAVIDFAAETGKVIELNANPLRLDLDWRQIIYAKKRGAKIAINPDIHNVHGFGHMQFGINIARKGWLTASDCINCLNFKEMKAFLSQKGRGVGAPSR